MSPFLWQEARLTELEEELSKENMIEFHENPVAKEGAPASPDSVFDESESPRQTITSQSSNDGEGEIANIHIDNQSVTGDYDNIEESHLN